MSTRFTLQEMVSGAIAQANEREKIAQAAEEPKPAPVPEKTDDEKDGIKCASVETGLIEKVASALEHINANTHLIEWDKVAVGKEMAPQAANAPAPSVGPGAGPGSDLDTNMDSPTAGMQSTDTGQATNNQPEPAGSTDNVGKADGQTNAQTAMKTDMKEVPGGTGMQPQLHQEGNLQVLKKASVANVRRLWRKIAADAENPAKIGAGSEPLENPDATAAEEGVPALPGPAAAQAKLVQTTDPAAPAGVTKQQAKAEPKRQMGEVLSEPAQKKSTDPVLQNNLDAASTAGVKISSAQSKAARTFLQKLAAKDEDPEATPEEKEKAKKLKAALEAKKAEKEKESMMAPTPGIQPNTMPSV